MMYQNSRTTILRFSAYLAGPITGTTYKECTNWREYFCETLPPEIVGYSPMRAKDYLQNELSVGDNYPAHLLSSQRGIYARDMNDCKTKDIIIVNLLGATTVSIGTVMEIQAFWCYGKPIVLIMEEIGNIHDHSMIREACPFRCQTLDEAVHLTTVILLPVGH